MEIDGANALNASVEALDSAAGAAITTSSESKTDEAAVMADTMVPMEQVASMIQKMREDQGRLLEQQREAIVQQVLQSIQASGAPVCSVVKGANASKRSPLRPPASSPAGRLEHNLHALVQHSLAESGLDFPHVYNSTNLSSTQQSKGGRSQDRGKPIVQGQSPTKKQVILARRELEGEGDSALPSDSTMSGDKLDEQTIETIPVAQVSKRPQDSELTRSPLRPTRLHNQRMHAGELGKRRQRRSRAAPVTKGSRVDERGDNDEYAEFVDPVDAAFNSIRKRVDQRTLAILDKSKMLLGQMQLRTLVSSRGGFVAKLRQRYADTDADKTSSRSKIDDRDHTDPEEENPTPIEAGDASTNDKAEASEQVTPGNEGDGAGEISGQTNLEGDVPVESPPDDKTSQPGDAKASPCEIELLRPPSNPPETEYEWENELARQILTIYATSVKAKALEQMDTKDSGQTNDDGRLPPSMAASTGKCKIETQRQRGATALGSTTVQNRSLGASCSLPAIRQGPIVPHTWSQHRLPSLASVHYSWEPSQRRDDGKVVINMPRVPRPIWFAGTGAVKGVWCALADGFSQLRTQQVTASGTSSSDPTSMCDHQLCEEVRRLEAKKKFAQCITTLESLLIALVRARGVGELETKLWKQLVVTCNAFASRCIDYKKFPAGLQLIKQAEHLIDNSILVGNTMRMELLAYLYDTYAHYYYRRRKPHAGLQYILKAHEIHSRQSSWAHLAKCRLHIANLLSFRIKHTEAMAYMASILEMIEENKLEEQSEGGGASAQKLCLAAVCYNNLAVEQLHLREFEAASVSSANAQRLAKLCLSYSNRWLAQFQATSDCTALAIATLMEDANANKEV